MFCNLLGPKDAGNSAYVTEVQYGCLAWSLCPVLFVLGVMMNSQKAMGVHPFVSKALITPWVAGFSSFLACASQGEELSWFTFKLRIA